MKIDRLGPGDLGRVLAAAAPLFDNPPRPEWTADFLARDGHHLLIAAQDGVDVGFVSGIEIAHPDKTAEMLLFEMGVSEPYRRRGIGRALTGALADLAKERGCKGMWAPTESDNEAAIATYRSAGASEPEEGVIMEWRFE